MGEVQDAVDAVRRGDTTTLDLSGLGLTELPRETLGAAPLITRLDLTHNELTEIPGWIGELGLLRTLRVEGNRLSDLPTEIGRLTGLRELSLGWGSAGNPLTRVPRTVASLPWLTQLLLDSCSLTELPSWLPDLEALERLDARSNDLVTLPSGVGEMHRLMTLDLGDNPIEALPVISHLQELSVSHRGLTEVPEWVLHQAGLTYLGLNHNRLTSLPPAMGRLTQLRSLAADHNPLGTFPDAVLDHLPTLRSLSLRRTGLTTLPPRIGELRELRRLKLDGNGLTSLPREVTTLPLDTLEVDGNPLRSPPVEVVDQGVDAIREYFDHIEQEGPARLAEAKLLIVGEPGAGKTSLARRLIDPQQPPSVDDAFTRGIEVVPWRFQGPEGHDITVNIWDFGGQEAYYANHQHFLTRNSAYVLVTDARREGIDFDYWLQVSGLMGGRSPLLVVLNDRPPRGRPHDGSVPWRRFPHLIGAVEVDLRGGAGLEAARDAIQRMILGLDHVVDAVPASWLLVRRRMEELRSAGRRHVTLDELSRISTEAGMAEREHLLSALQYFHELGICLHFRDDDFLQETVILDPAWGVDAIYRVLDDPQTIEAWGRFDADDVGRIWDEDRDAGMHATLLALMLRFRFCYQVPGTDSYLAPQLLSPEEPNHGWDLSRPAVVRFEYGFMPKGVMAELIVRLHHLAPDGAAMWRHGLVLEQDGVSALVVESEPGRCIEIRVRGPASGALLLTVVEALEDIGRAYGGLEVRRLILCPCTMCATSTTPQLHDVDQLRRFRDRTSKTTRECGESGQSIEIRRILDTIDPTDPPPTVFVSYKRQRPDTDVVDELRTALTKAGIHLIIDRDEVWYRDRISDFMDRLGQGDAIVVVLSHAYLRSEKTMYELLQISQQGRGFANAIHPIRLLDVRLNDALGRSSYIAYWDDALAKLEERARRMRSFAHGLHADINLYSDIRRGIGDILQLLDDINAETLEHHRATGYEDIIDSIRGEIGLLGTKRD